MTALLVAVLSANAYGCGESLYRVGKGMSYRVYTAPLPGNLLVFAPSEGGQELADELAKSGHGVHLVTSIDEFESELATGGYDVVIAPYSEHAGIESAGSETSASYLPIAFSKEDERLANQSYDRVMNPEKDEIKHYLKAIHRALKNRA